MPLEKLPQEDAISEGGGGGVQVCMYAVKNLDISETGCVINAHLN